MRRETTMTVPLPAVVDAVLDAIRRNREIVTVPRYWGWFARALYVGAIGAARASRVTRRRVDDLYQR